MRKSNFELLRCISMILIILCHMIGYSNVIRGCTANSYVALMLWLWGGLGVNCFMMISAYFLVDTEFHFKRYVKVEFKTLFYSISLLIAALFGIKIDSGLSAIMKGIFPVLSGEYWYVTAYCGVLLLSPFLNSIIIKLEKENWKKLIIVCTVLLSVLPNLIPILTYYSDLVWLVYLYILTGGVKHYHIKRPKIKTCIWIFIVCVTIIYASAGIAFILSWHYSIFSIAVGYFSTRCVFIMLICSLALFFIFEQWELGYSKIINWVAKGTFGVYLLHENPCINNFLWHNVFSISLFFDKAWFGIYCLGVAVIIMILGGVIDCIAEVFLQRLYNMKQINMICKRYDRWIGGK